MNYELFIHAVWLAPLHPGGLIFRWPFSHPAPIEPSSMLSGPLKFDFLAEEQLVRGGFLAQKPPLLRNRNQKLKVKNGKLLNSTVLHFQFCVFQLLLPFQKQRLTGRIVEKALYLASVLALNNSCGLCEGPRFAGIHSSNSGPIWNSSCVRSN